MQHFIPHSKLARWYLLCVALAAGLVLILSRLDDPLIFFRSQLRSINGHEVVTLSGRLVTLDNGNITAPAHLSKADQFQSYRLAYALELAKRDPVLGLAGTDPERLRTNVNTLSQVLRLVAADQSNTKDATLVRTSLYPLSFLGSLSTTEEARLAFIASPSTSTEEVYEAAVAAALNAGSSDISAFRSAYTMETEDASTSANATFGGIISVSDMRTAISVIGVRMQEASSTEVKRTQCLNGTVTECDPGALSLSVTLTNLPSGTAPDTAPVLTLMKDSDTRLLTSTRTEAILTRSACLAELPGPYPFITPSLSAQNDYLPTAYLGDVFFSPMNLSAPVPSYMHATYGTSLLRLNPMVFYECPELQVDLGSLRAVLAITRYAEEHSGIATSSRETLLGDKVPREDHALSYLAQVIRDFSAIKQALPDQVTSLVLMTEEKSAGLEILLGQIATVLQTDTQLRASGVPMDVSAHTLFLTHSALPSVYIVQNNSAGTSAVILRRQNPEEHTDLLAHYERLSDLRNTMSYSALVAANRAMNEFESDIR